MPSQCKQACDVYLHSVRLYVTFELNCGDDDKDKPALRQKEIWDRTCVSEARSHRSRPPPHIHTQRAVNAIYILPLLNHHLLQHLSASAAQQPKNETVDTEIGGFYVPVCFQTQYAVSDVMLLFRFCRCHQGHDRSHWSHVLKDSVIR